MEKLLGQEALSRWVIEHPNIWQENLINDNGLARLATERGLGFSNLGDDIKRLWQLGLLRADLIISESPLDIDGLVLIDESTVVSGWEEEVESLRYTYADNRVFSKWEDGVIGAINKLPEFPKQVDLLFHPFRYYVLNQIEEKFKVRVNSTLLLRSPNTYSDWLQRITSALEKWSTQEEFGDKIRHWNDVVTLAIGAEPFTFNKLFGYYSFPYNVEEGDFNALVETYYQKYKQVLEEIGLEKIKSIKVNPKVKTANLLF